jgi:hypothetical protein
MAGGAALVVGVLAAATNIATGIPPPNSWTAARNPLVMWPVVGALLLATAVLAVWAARSSAGRDHDDGGGSVRSKASIKGTVTGSVIAPAARSGSAPAVTGGTGTTTVTTTGEPPAQTECSHNHRAGDADAPKAAVATDVSVRRSVSDSVVAPAASSTA